MREDIRLFWPCPGTQQLIEKLELAVWYRMDCSNLGLICWLDEEGLCKVSSRLHVCDCAESLPIETVARPRNWRYWISRSNLVTRLENTRSRGRTFWASLMIKSSSSWIQKSLYPDLQKQVLVLLERSVLFSFILFFSAPSCTRKGLNPVLMTSPVELFGSPWFFTWNMFSVFPLKVAVLPLRRSLFLSEKSLSTTRHLPLY